jgi:flagellar biosynthesis chaperone FliJ
VDITVIIIAATVVLSTAAFAWQKRLSGSKIDDLYALLEKYHNEIETMRGQLNSSRQRVDDLEQHYAKYQIDKIEELTHRLMENGD